MRHCPALPLSNDLLDNYGLPWPKPMVVKEKYSNIREFSEMGMGSGGCFGKRGKDIPKLG